MNKSLLVGAAVLLALFLTNPDRDDFRHHLERRFEREANLDEESALGAVLGEVVTGGAAALIARAAERRDYLLFSTYRLGGQGDGEGLEVSIEGEDRWLGLLGQFIAL
jgi:hypothetical protein